MPSPTPLNKPSVDANLVETTVMDLWEEFLSRYFDAGAHAIGATAAAVFPKAELNFQQSAASQPLDKAPASGVAITLVWNEGGGRAWRVWEPIPQGEPNAGQRQEIVFQKVSWNFWVRATGANARRNGKTAADRLFGVLGNSAETRVLAQAGIQRVRPQPPRAVQDGDYSLRLVCVAATLRYPVLSQTTATP